MIETDVGAARRVGAAGRYVVSGVALGGVAVLVVALTGPEFVAVTAVPLVGAGVIAVIDQRTTRIATRHAVLLAVITLVCVGAGILVDRGSWWSVAAGAAVWALPMFALAVGGGFGGGDFKYACSLGALAGWVSLSSATTGLLIAVVAAAIAGSVTAIRQRTSRSQVPLGVPLYVGVVAGIALRALAQ